MTVPPSDNDAPQDQIEPEETGAPVTIPIEKPLATSGSHKRPRIAPKQPPSLLKKGIIGLILAMILYTIFGFFIAPLLITSVGVNYLEKRVKRPVTIGTAQVNPFRFHIVLKNGIIGAEKNNPEDKVDPLFSFGRLKLKIHPQAVFTDQSMFQAIQGNSVFLHIVRNQDGESNLSQLLQAKDQKTSPNLQAIIGKLKQIDLELTDAKLLFADQQSGTTHTVDQIRFRLPNASDQGDSPYFSASINGSPMEFGGFSGQESGSEQSFQLHFKDISLPAYLSYLPAPFPTLISKGKADLDITITTKHNKDNGYAVTLAGTGQAQDIWVNDGKENHNKITAATFSFSSGLNSKQVVFHKLILEKPEIHVSRTPKGEFFFPAKQSFTNPPADKSVAIETIVIKNGKLIFIDQNVPGGFAASFNEVNLSIDTNNDSHTGSYALNCVTNRKTRISSQGTLTPTTWELNGLFILQGLPLSALNSYLGQPEDITITSGLVEKLETSFTLLPLTAHKLQSLTGSQLAIKDLALNFKGKKTLIIPQLTMANSHYSKAKQHANLGQVNLRNSDFSIIKGVPLAPPPFTAGADHIRWTMDELVIADSMAHIRDFKFLKKPQTIIISNFKGINLSSDPKDTATIETKIKLLKQATSTIKGTIQSNPLRGSLTAEMSNVPLVHIPDPLLGWLKPTLLGGFLSAQTQFSFPNPTFTGSAKIKGLKLRYGDQHELLTIKNIHSEGYFSLAPLDIKVKQAAVTGMETGLSISRKKLFSRQDFFTLDSDSLGSPATVSINNIKIDKSRFTFADRTLEPPFSYRIENIRGSIDHIDSTGVRPSALALEGVSKDQSNFNVSGTSQFFSDSFKAELKVRIKDFPLAPINSFVEPIAGYGLKGGMFDLDIDYHETEGVMSSTTLLDLRHLTLSGEDMGNNHFPDIVALLTDSSHHIRLSLPVSGDATDPHYTYQSAYGKKLNEFFLATMVSPFSALGDYYNEAQNPPNQIIFTPGQSSLVAEQQDTLLAVQTILKNRPLLHIILSGYSGSKEDRDNLLKEKMAKALSKNQAQAIDAAGTAAVKNYGQELITPKQNIPTNLTPKTTTLTKQELQDLALRRSEHIKSVLMQEYGVDGSRLHIDQTPTVVPQSDSGTSGHRVEFILSGIVPEQ